MPHITFDIHPDLIDLVPHPRPASKFVPDWYKDMKNTCPMKERANDRGDHVTIDAPTVKMCLPVRDYLTSGYIIPAWKDHRVLRNSAGHMESIFEHEMNDGYSMGCSWHGIHQFEKSPLSEFSDGQKMLKIINPWRIKTPKGYSCLFYSPFYQKSDFTILPAIVDTDTHDVPVNFPTIVTSDDAYLKMGDPLVQVLPFKRESWSHKVEAASEKSVKKANLKNALLWGSFYTQFDWKRKVFR